MENKSLVNGSKMALDGLNATLKAEGANNGVVHGVLWSFLTGTSVCTGNAFYLIGCGRDSKAFNLNLLNEPTVTPDMYVCVH